MSKSNGKFRAIAPVTPYPGRAPLGSDEDAREMLRLRRERESAYLDSGFEDETTATEAPESIRGVMPSEPGTYPGKIAAEVGGPLASVLRTFRSDSGRLVALLLVTLGVIGLLLAYRLT